MVCEWGMNEKLGPLSYEKTEGPVFLGMQNGHASKNYSEAKAEEIDREVFGIIDRGYKLAVEILKNNRAILDSISQALLEYETLDGAEIELLIGGAPVKDIEKHRAEKKEISSQVTTPVVEDKNSSEDSGPVGNRGPVTV
jgi:cell division protease FtsH